MYTQFEILRCREMKFLYNVGAVKWNPSWQFMIFLENKLIFELNNFSPNWAMIYSHTHSARIYEIFINKNIKYLWFCDPPELSIDKYKYVGINITVVSDKAALGICISIK